MGVARAAAYLQHQATRLQSRMLADLAAHAREDPFMEARTMIQALIDRLLAEAAEDEGRKGFCDKELTANLQARTDKKRAVEALDLDVASLNASLVQLGEDIQ